METKSNLKVVLQVILGLVALAFVGSAAFLGFILYHLPSGKEVSSAFLKPNPQVHTKASQSVSASTVSEIITSVPSAVTTTAADVSSTSMTRNASAATNQAANSKASLDDLINPNRPLSNFCSSLKNAKVGKMSNQEVNRSFDVNQALPDPRAQSLKPVLRYIFRLPELQDLIATAEQASTQQQEEGLTDKAAFYAKAVAAFAAMRSHKEDFEAVADRSYLFYKLNAVVAKKPELLGDQRLQKFCDDTENAFNTNQEVQFDQEKSNFERLLAELDVDQASIGYDPNYKTRFDIQLNDKGLRLTGGWIEEIFSK